MKKREQKGFTIVELVIVIAVIAVLATVLVPTFGDLIGRAQAAAATQQVANAYKEALVKALADNGIITEGEAIEVDPFTFIFSEGGQGAQIRTEDFPYPQVCIVDGKVQLGPKNEAGETTEATKEQEQTIEVKSIAFERAKLPLSVGEEQRLCYTIMPAGAVAKGQVEWITSDASVATVTDDGTVTAKGVGKAIITASVDEQTASCEVDVTFKTTVDNVSGLSSIFGKTYDGERKVSLTTDITNYNNVISTSGGIGTVVLDLHGHELTVKKLITVNDGCELIIMNGKLSTTSYIKVDNGGKLTIINCELSSSGYYVVYDAGAVAITDSTIKYESGSCAIYVGYATGEASLDLVRTNITAAEAAIQVSDNDIVNITGGTITSTTTSKGIYAIDVLNGQGTVNFYKDGNNFVTITAKNAYTQNSNDGATSCFVGKDNVKIQAPA